MQRVSLLEKPQQVLLLVDSVLKQLSHAQNFGCAAGTGVSVTPIAFLTVTPDSTISIIPINDEKTTSDRFITMIERSPEIIERIKNIMS